MKLHKRMMCYGTIAAASFLAGAAGAADIDYGKPGTPVKISIGYQPYYTQSW